jgi:hypothetical protein
MVGGTMLRRRANVSKSASIVVGAVVLSTITTCISAGAPNLRRTARLPRTASAGGVVVAALKNRCLCATKHTFRIETSILIFLATKRDGAWRINSVNRNREVSHTEENVRNEWLLNS